MAQATSAGPVQEQVRSRAATTLWLLVGMAALRFALHMLLNGRYDLHRDEMALVDYAGRLAWGYVEYPPLTPALVRLQMEIFGDSLVALRTLSALAQGLTVLLAGLIAREMGGGRGAQMAAAGAAFVVPFSLVSGSMTQYASFDYLWWLAVAWALVRLCAGRDPRGWLLVGLCFGLGLQTKYTILVLAAGVAVGVMLTPLRRDLRSPWLWAGAALALLIAAPNLWWQARHDWIAIEFTQAIHARDVEWGRTQAFLPEQLYANANPLTLPLWIAGLVWLFTRRGRAFRALGWAYATALALFVLLAARGYYLAGLYPALMAAGSVGIGQWLEARRPGTRRAVWGTLAALIGVGGVVGALLALPLGPVGSWPWNVSAAVTDVYREQLLWPEVVAATAEAWQSLTPAEQAQTGIYTANYGEAGAINRYGAAYGLPRAFSSVNTYWLWGPPPPPPVSAIVVGYRREWLERDFTGCRQAATVQNPLGIENEEAATPAIWFCAGTVEPVEQAWPFIRRFG
jgi:4-amino-4-deoxy-L-arabinose transferase-like glycosyltransferase